VEYNGRSRDGTVQCYSHEKDAWKHTSKRSNPDVNGDAEHISSYRAAAGLWRLLKWPEHCYFVVIARSADPSLLAVRAAWWSRRVEACLIASNGGVYNKKDPSTHKCANFNAAARDALRGPAASGALLGALLLFKDNMDHCHPSFSNVYEDPAFQRSLARYVLRLRVHFKPFALDSVWGKQLIDAGFI